MQEESKHHGPFEVRTISGDLDELVVDHASVHVEQMSSHGWFIGIQASGVSFMLNIGTDRAPVTAILEEDSTKGAVYTSAEWKKRYGGNHE